MPVSKSMQDLIENDIERLRSAIKSKHISVHKELYDSILQTYDTVVPDLTDGLEEIEKPVDVVSPFRKKPAVRSTRLNGELLRINLGKLAARLEIYLDNDGDVTAETEPSLSNVSIEREKIRKSEPAPPPPPPLSEDQGEIVSSIDIAMDTVEKRTDLSAERREEFKQVLSEIKAAIVYEDNKKERWKLLRPLLSWAYNQTDPLIASDMLFLLSEAIR